MSGFEGKVDEDKIRADIVATIALQAPRKPAGAFPGGERYHPSSQGVKRTSELTRLIKQQVRKCDEKYREYGLGDDYLVQCSRSIEAIKRITGVFE